MNGWWAPVKPVKNNESSGLKAIHTVRILHFWPKINLHKKLTQVNLEFICQKVQNFEFFVWKLFQIVFFKYNFGVKIEIFGTKIQLFDTFMSVAFVNFGAKIQICLKLKFCQNCIFGQKSGISNSVAILGYKNCQVTLGNCITHHE